MQRFFCIGNLTKDPETQSTPSGVSVCKFNVAVNRDYSNADGTKETDFFKVTTWRAVAENCGKYLKKGSKVAIVGKVQNRTYEANDGTKRNVTEIIAEQVEFLTPKQNENAPSFTPLHDNKGTPFDEQGEIDDIPF